jgi:hypothetical protein
MSNRDPYSDQNLANLTVCRAFYPEIAVALGSW